MLGDVSACRAQMLSATCIIHLLCTVQDFYDLLKMIGLHLFIFLTFSLHLGADFATYSLVFDINPCHAE